MAENQADHLVLHDTDYLQSTRLVPRYADIALPDELSARINAKWNDERFLPMGRGMVLHDMGTTGERGEIGPLPSWQAWYLITSDKRFLSMTLRQGELSGSWPIHYRDYSDGFLPTVDKYPYITKLGNRSDANNPKTKKNEYLHGCQTDCASLYFADSAHQPSFAYLPYLLSGEHFYLREIQFWANFNLIRLHPEYRSHSQGLLHRDQVRGQAWAMRTLAHSALVTGEHDRLQKYFANKLNNNISWYNNEYTSNNKNSLGWIHPMTEKIQISPWMDDFMTWSASHLVDLGYTEITPFAKWKANFAVQRLTSPDYCWVLAAPYRLPVFDAENNTFMPNLGASYAALSDQKSEKLGVKLNTLDCGSKAMFDALEQPEGTIPGNYTMILQIAVASAVNLGIPGADEAWKVFRDNSKHLIHSRMPEYAILPGSNQ